MKTTIKLLVGIAAMMLPALAFAHTINPPGGNAWDLFTTGNGPMLSQALTAIKLILSSGTFRALFAMTATIAFVVMAVQTSMDAGKHGYKLVGFCILISFLYVGMYSDTVNLNIDDPLSAQMSANTGKYGSPTVTGVPAVVGLPAALISSVGHWLTKEFETALSLPGQLSLTNGGTFNIFGRMLADSNKFVITNPGLKKSLSAYISDCAIPAMAYGKINSNDLLTSQDLFATLANAKSNAIMTRFYPGDSDEVVKKADGTSYATCAPGSYVQGHSGALMSCAQAYSCLQQDLDKHATMIENAAAQSWQNSGVMTPFEEEFKTVLSWASGGLDLGTDGSTISPGGLIKQKAMIAALSGSFRDAAAQTGNNSLLTDAAITQAEQSQVSGWATSAAIFNNVMGFVVDTLQVFIYVVVPLIIVALLIPGFGLKIGKNYVQFLFWLALLEPTFAIINFVIALWGQGHVSSALAQHGGWTAGGAWAVSSAVNKMNLAASVLGTSVPLIVWGLVKGSMAITEFISHGMVASFGAQAGAAAASGSFNMGNVQMDNISTSKYNTASSISVGDQGVNAFMGAGAATTTYDYGGPTGRVNGQTMTISRSHSTAQDIQEAKNHQAQIAQGYTQQHSGVIQHVFGANASVNTLSGDMSNVTKNRNLAIAKKSGLSEDQLTDVAEIKALQAEGKTSEAKQMQAKVGLSTSQLSAGADALRQIANNSGLSASKTNNAGSKDSHANGLSSGATGSTSTARNDTVSGGKQQGDLTSAGWTAAGALAIASVANGSIGDSYSYVMGRKETTTQQLTMPQGFDPVAYETGGYAGEVAPLDVGNISAERRAAEEQILGRRAGADSRASAFEGRAETLYGNYGKPIADPNSTPRSSYDMYAPGSAANPTSSSQSFAGKVDTGMTDRAKHREKIKAATDAASDKTRYSTDYNANRNTALFTKPTTNYKTGHIELDPNYYPGKKTAHTIAGGVQKGEETVVNTLGNIPTH